MTRRDDVRLPLADTTLYALDQGEGAAILFFHGGLADHRAALLHVGALAERLRLITPDLRGAGRSRWGGELSWALLAQDARDLLDHLGVERAVVGGVSMGSAVALRFALQFPERAAGLALVHPVYPGAELGVPEPSRLAMLAMDALGQRVRTEGTRALYPLFETLPAAIRGRAMAMVDSFDPESVAATTRFLASDAQPFQIAAELARLSVPTLVVPGVDPTHPAEVAERLAGAIPGAELARLEGVALSERLERLALAGVDQSLG